MPQFRYTALNRQKKQLSGAIQAENEQTARKKLNEIGFSILSIAEEKTPQTEETIGNRFAFEAFDVNKKKITGTIIAQDKLEAYQRLTEEYNFTTTAIYSANATPEEKMLAQREGTEILQKQIVQVEKDIKAKETKTKEEEEIRRKALIAQVNFALHKVDELLTRYRDEINPDSKKLIKAAVDRLLRIRSSTNLDYIENTTESLLRLIQDEELFLHHDQFQKDRKKIALETEQIVMSLHRARHKHPFHIHAYLENQAINPTQTIRGKIAYAIAKNMLRLWSEDENITNAKEKKKIVREQMITAIRIIITTKNRDLRDEARNSMKGLWREYLRLRKEIQMLKKQKRIEKKQTKKPQKILYELNLLTGCLLLFYIAYYLAAQYLATTSANLTHYVRYVLVENHLLMYIVLFLFLFHASTSISITFFPKNRIAPCILLPASLITYLLLLINL